MDDAKQKTMMERRERAARYICGYLAVYGPFPEYDEMVRDGMHLWDIVAAGGHLPKYPQWTQFDMLILAGEVGSIFAPDDDDDEEEPV